MSFLTKGWPFIVFGALTLLCLIQHLQVKSLRIERDAARQQIELANQTIERQNAGILELKRVEALQKKQMDEAIKRAELIKQASDKRYDEVINEQVPTECREAIQWAAEKGPEISS